MKEMRLELREMHLDAMLKEFSCFIYFRKEMNCFVAAARGNTRTLYYVNLIYRFRSP